MFDFSEDDQFKPTAMQNAFKVSNTSEAVIKLWLESRGWTLTAYTDKNDQLTKGDYLGVHPVKGTKNIELKAEQKDKHGNLFIESWSNADVTRGWFFNLSQCDTLLYHFLDDKTCYVINMEKLRQFPVDAYPEKSQCAYQQKNTTLGWCVPSQALIDAGVAGKYRW